MRSDILLAALGVMLGCGVVGLIALAQPTEPTQSVTTGPAVDSGPTPGADAGKTARPSGQFQITQPQNGEAVPCIVRNAQGSGVAPNSAVWVIVHPLLATAADQYWVQPVAMVTPSGDWQAPQVHVGECQDRFAPGQKFELRAVINPRAKLSDGQVLASWPDGDKQSDIITVTRN